MLEAIPQTVKAIAVLDRPRSRGAQAKLLYLDVMTMLAVFSELAPPRFTVGIYDDVTQISLPRQSRLEALFYGLVSDGAVSATKSSIKIIGNATPLFAQGYFVYDSKKAGG